MRLLTPFLAISWALGVVGQEKSFVANPIIGSPRLNRIGLHLARVRLAARMATLRRRALAEKISAADRAAFDRDGFILKPGFLPPDLFEAVRAEIFGGPLPAHEMRQGQTVTRIIPLSARNRARLPHALAAMRDPALTDLAGYVAGRSGAPIHFVQTVIAEPDRGAPDPQTELHADTFHSNAKLWLFLHDVGEEDGPFLFVPGSHRLTPERLDWEYRQSLTAARDPRPHHGFGSFRIRTEELAALGLPPPRPMVVRANTLVVADTFGFHARAVSAKPTIRVEIYGALRRNPFPPWNGFDLRNLPGISGRALDIHLAWMGRRARRGLPAVWRDVGEVRADAAPTL
ncbi:MAG TPA: phytanoyl-CoA dioxygenase family protein [Paracoccaceae bacterium]|nr:phytanoyl-CoA dioxygenase family protein [Paracoccaceae bacterium]